MKVTAIQQSDSLGARILAILGVGLLYMIAGHLSLMLAIPPGYATAIWPPSGIALVAVLVYGYRVWPGVLLGSFFVNVFTAIDTSSFAAVLASLSVPAGIGAGAALQAVVGAYLVRRFAKFPNTLGNEREVFAFLFWGGPASCLVNSFIGTSTLFLAGIIPAASFAINFGTWWIGDTIGVLIFAPLALVWLLQPKEIWRPRRLTVTVPVLLAFTLTVAAVAFGANWERQSIKLQFDRQAAAAKQALGKTLDGYLHAFLSLKDYFDVSETVDRESFKSFASRTLSHMGGIHALSWNPRVKAADLAEFEEKTRQEGLILFRATERDENGVAVPVKPRPEYFIVHYIEPLAGNAAALGFDVGSNPARRAALDRARDSGQATATERITLVQGAGNDFGVLILAPVYKKGLPAHTIEERRQNLSGYTVAVLRGNAIIGEAIKEVDSDGLVFRLYDATDAEQPVALFESHSEEKGVFILEETGLFGGRTQIGQKFQLEIGGRTWRLDILPDQEFLAHHRQDVAWVILFAGMLLTTMVGAFVLVISGRGELLRQLVVERTENLQESETRLATAQRIARLGNWEWNVLTNEMWLSDEVYRILGIEPGPALTDLEGFLSHVHPDDRQHVEQEINAVLRTHKAFNIEHRIVLPFGGEKYVHQQGQMTLDKNDYANRVMGTIQDITERRRLDKMKNEFVSTVSHELRTPLTSIKGSLGLMASGTLGVLPDKMKQMVEIAYKNSDRLATLVNDILDIEKIESGTMEFDLRELDLSRLVTEAVDANAGYAREYGVEYVLADLAPDAVVSGDDSRLTQVVSNLLSNAAKFSPQGSTVEVAVSRSNGSAKVTVSDHGPGIPDTFRNQVFGRFTQADSSNQREKGGTGLGLNISQSIIERHGGVIGFTSKEGDGTTFYFTVPTV